MVPSQPRRFQVVGDLPHVSVDGNTAADDALPTRVRFSLSLGARMAKRIKCPACGTRGELGDDSSFEVRGRAQNRAVQKCLVCGSGLFVKLPSGRTEVIPHDLWIKMQDRWDHEFGVDAVPDNRGEEDAYPAVTQAVQELFDATPDELSLYLLVLASAAQDVAAAALRQVAAGDPDAWAELDVEAAKAVVRCGAAYFVLAATNDETLRRYFSEWLDLRPSQVSDAVLAVYTETFLTSAETDLVGTVKSRWDDEDSQGYAMAIGRMMWQAGGREGTPPITDVMQWRVALHGLREPFGQHFMSELERFAET